MTSYLSQANEFKFHANSITEYIQEEGIAFRPFTHPSLPLFHRLQEPEQQLVLSALKICHRSIETIKNRGESIKDNRLILYETLKAFEFDVTPDNLNLIADDHLITITSPQHLQIFRNFLYFETFSHTLEDICCRRWFNLFEQSNENLDAVLKVFDDFLHNANKIKARPVLSASYLKEKYTVESLAAMSTIEWIVPLFRGQEFAALMVLSKIETGEAIMQT